MAATPLLAAGSRVRAADGAPDAGQKLLLVETTVAARQARVDSAIETVVTFGYAEPADGGGTTFVRAAREPGHAFAFRSADGGWWEGTVRGHVSARQLGALGDDRQDDTAALQDAIDAVSANGGGIVYVPVSVAAYRLEAPLTPADDVMLVFEQGATLKQHGSSAIAQTPGSLLSRFGVVGARFHYAGSGAAHDCALALGAHQRCRFEHLDFTGYDRVGVIRRKASGRPGGNTVFNRHAHWYVDRCAWFDWAQGLDESYAEHAGDGSTTAFPVSWAFNWPGDLAVGLWQADGSVERHVPGAGVTVSGGGGAGPAAPGTVVFARAPGPGDLVMIWPKNARDRVSPISGNVWDQITVRRFTKFLHAGVRYVDSERFCNLYGQAVADGARHFLLNPFSRGNAETDLYAVTAPTLVYRDAPGEVSDEATVSRFEFGPGAARCIVHGVISDRPWSNPVVVRDTEEEELTGSVATTAGSNRVTGTGTRFTHELTLIGNVADRIVIDGTEKAITAIDSDTELETDGAWETTLSARSARKSNPVNHVSYAITEANPIGGNRSRPVRLARKSGSEGKGIAVVPGDGVSTSVIVRWGRLLRAPGRDEITLTPLSRAAASRTPWVETVSGSSFVIAVSAAASAGLEIGWRIRLQDYRTEP